MNPMSPARPMLLAVAWILGTALVHDARGEDTLSVCVDEANPTAAIDLRLARALAKTQGVAVKAVTFVGFGKGGDGLPASRFAKMALADCQLIMGFPVDVSNPHLPPDVKATSPYARTGFVLVQRSGARNRALEELPQGSEVGIAALDTYGGLLFGENPQLVMHVYPKDSLMLADLAAARITAGIAWQPSVEAVEDRRRKRFEVTALAGKHMQWDLVALYAESSGASAQVFERGLGEIASNGAWDRLVAPYRHPESIATHGQLNARESPFRAAVAWDSDSAPRFIQVAAHAAGGTTGATAKHAAAPAIYTQDQAAKGALAYYQNCSMCHGPLLDGQAGGYSGPALKGRDFADPSYDFHVSDIFNFVAKQMPAATPGSLSHEQDVEIMAFILKQNGYPAGPQELVYEAAEKSKVPIRYYGK